MTEEEVEISKCKCCDARYFLKGVVDNDDSGGDSPRDWDNSYTLVTFTRRGEVSHRDEGARHIRNHDDAMQECHIASYAWKIYGRSDGGFWYEKFDGESATDQNAELCGYAWADDEDWDADAAERCIEGELETYSDYLSGNVWMYKIVLCIEKGDAVAEIETLDSLFDIYGEDYAIREMKENLKFFAKEQRENYGSDH